MDYLTNYYKNLSEQLQEKLNLLEAGYGKALRSGNKEKMEKELARQKYLERFKEELSNKGLPIGMENFDTLDPEVQREMKPSAAARMARMIARTGGKKGQYTTGREGHKENIEDLAMQLDSEYPKKQRRITVAELPSTSPFPSDYDYRHVTPQQY
jgi:hypothetical protein